MTPISPARLREMVGEATALPWCTDPFQPDYPGDGVPIIGLRLDGDGKPLVTPTNGIVAAACLLPTEIDALDASRAEANAALIVAAVNSLPRLLDEIEGLKTEAELFDADHADQNRMVDRIADLIGIPHDQELDTTAFELWFSAQAGRIAELERERDRLQAKVDAFTNGETFLVLREEDRAKAAAELSDADLVKWVRWALVSSAQHFESDDRSAMEVLTMRSVINLAALVHASNATKATFSVDGVSWKGVPDGGDWTVTITRSDAPPVARAALERRS
ncbi:hypothetical protein [Sphingomonas abietis]|uniref:Uncharacterized protein n=1 Tax=Sphingomonas abietis TaxID=3012344 RepID=A0ABY7NQS5_9SPHN|nr:hypothetical protein [Sphingomonas abietis]WBO23899.1 hypothetical protein PBT88_07265 [Sphingomonas abietis]